MSATASAGASADPGRRCSPRGPAPEALRPTDVLGAFFLLGLAYLTVGTLVAIVHGVADWPAGRWLALHLVFLGGVSQLVLGASQFFVGAFLATEPPARALVRAQLGLWNAGTLAVVAAVALGVPAGAQIGALTLVAALVLYASGLRAMQRRSLQRARWAVRWYYACAALLVPGLVAGVLLARGTAWPTGDLLATHLTLNLAGWLGTAIVGTLHTLFPSLTATSLSFPKLESWTFASWTAGVLALAAGSAFAIPALAIVGWTLLLTGATCLGANVLGSLRATSPPLTLPARLLATGQAALLAGLAVALTESVVGTQALVVGSARAAVAALVLAGWLGLTVLGSVLHLLAVLLRVRVGRALPVPRPTRDRWLVALAVTSVFALATAQLLGLGAAVAPAAALLAAVYALLACKVLTLAVPAARTARPSV